MKETSPLERVLDQVTELYNQILLNQHKNLETSPEILENLKRLSSQIEEISRLTEAEVARVGISSDAIKKTILEPKEKLPPDLQSLLEKSQYLKGQLEGCRNVLKDIMKKQRKEKGPKRADKFNKLGRKKGWIPL